MFEVWSFRLRVESLGQHGAEAKLVSIFRGWGFVYLIHSLEVHSSER